MEALLSYYEIFVFSLTLVWLLLFILRTELQREMMVLGFLALFLLPLAFTINQADVSEGFATLHILDLLLSFVLAGIAGGIFHGFLGKHYHALPKPRKLVRQKEDQFTQFWLLRLFFIFLVFAWAVVLLAYFFTLSIPESVLLSAIMLAVYTVSHRKDLLADTLASALLTALVVFVAGFIASSFDAVDFTIAPISSTATFLSVPIDLLLWSGALGLAIGPLYEFIRRFELT